MSRINTFEGFQFYCYKRYQSFENNDSSLREFRSLFPARDLQLLNVKLLRHATNHIANRHFLLMQYTNHHQPRPKLPLSSQSECGWQNIHWRWNAHRNHHLDLQSRADSSRKDSANCIANIAIQMFHKHSKCCWLRTYYHTYHTRLLSNLFHIPSN